ncbi:MAG: WD40 repeat domain-containing protein [Pseudomonadota bacterium]|nr:WD40 repeat domain-containing protein [Pseudomonadota bacterium]
MTFRNLVQALAATASILPAMHALAAPDSTPLRLVQRIDVPGFDGDFDHFGVDLKGNRLFLAGEDKGTLEIFNLRTGKHLKTVDGLEEPHAIHFVPQSDKVMVSNSGDGLSKILDGKSYAVVGTIRVRPGADVMSYDASTNQLWMVTGGKNASAKLPHTFVNVVDASTGSPKGEFELDTDFTEAIAFEQKGHRAFINVSGKSCVAVIDKDTRKMLATWPIKEGLNNAPMALDEADKRLFVVTRKPFRLVVLDTDTGATIASFDAPQRTNDLIYDKANHRLYLAGDDHVAVFDQADADHYAEVARIPSDKGAKTAILVPELHRLFVAVAGKQPTKAGVLEYDVLPAARH